MSNPSTPILQAPGAGLPALEEFFLRRYFRTRLLFATREGVAAEFALRQGAIVDRVAAIPADRRGEPVLIPRPRGLEDSSRHWSVWMTLDHLRIVNRAFAGIIRTLAAGKVPPGQADTARVKPSPGAGAESEVAFAESCERLVEVVDSLREWKTPLQFPHPWFGALDASGWHALAAFHLGVHLRQLEAIARGLGRS